MNEDRAVFLMTVAAAVPLFEAPELAARWDEESALDRWSVRGLAGHLLRATTSVEAYLDRPEPEPDEEVLSASAYYAATGGPEALARDWAEAAARLAARLATEAPDRRVRVFNNLVIVLDDYLVTRLVELCLHVDDLAVSLGVDPPPLPASATGRVVATLVELARARHGDVAVLRALARRERDTAAALRVL